MYRIRSIKQILGDYQELEKQQIYFAPFDELNDPLEGVCEMLWQGDSIVWRNFLCHYLLCLNNKFIMAILSGSDGDFAKSEKDIFVQMAERDLPGRYGEVFKQVKSHFLSKREIALLVECLSERNIPIQRNELSYHLKTINRTALHSIVFVHIENGLYQDSADLLGFLHDDGDSTITSITALKNASDEEVLEELFRYFNLAHEQLTLQQYYSSRTAEGDNKLAYLLIDFPRDFSTQMDELVYSKWYLACFMSSCTNTSIWGNYGSNHTGICLKFKTYEKDNKLFLPIERPVGFNSSGLIIEPREMYFDKVEYGNDRERVDFFRSILTLPTPVLFEEWYSDGAGATSVCADFLKRIDIDQEERKKYWDNLKRIATSKSIDWKDENEYRLILTPLLIDYPEKKDRLFRYDFNDLEGIIFGMRTPIDAKIEILAILDRKCQEHKRHDFKIYQADYDHKKKEMVIDELKLIQFR